MPRTKLIDLPLRTTDGSERVLIANTSDTYCSTLSSLELSHNAITSLGGSASRSLKSRFSESINVKDYGAIGDGYVNDTTAIQNALNNSNNKILIFPAGNYLISSSLNLPTTVTITGYNATIKQTTKNKHIFGAFTTLDQVKGIIIEGLTFEGYGYADTASTVITNTDTSLSRAYGIWLVNTQDVIIRDCAFLNFKNSSIFVNTCKGISIRNNKFKGTRPDSNVSDNDTNECQSAVYFVKGQENVDGGCIISNNTISDVNYGIKMDGFYTETTIDNNNLYNIGVNGIAICPASNLTVSNNIIEALYKGVEIKYNIEYTNDIPQNIRIVQNSVRSATQYGIHVYVAGTAFNTHYLNFVKISDNILVDITGDGILTYFCNNVDISNNSLQNITGIGVRLETGTGRIAGNILSHVSAAAFNMRPVPYGQITLHSNTTTNGGNNAVGGYINAYKSHVSQVWQRDQLYPVDSFIITGVKVYRSLSSGRSAYTGDGPTGITTVDDNGIVWKYLGHLNDLDGGEVHITQNVINANPIGTPLYCLYSEPALRLDWRDNNFPLLQISNDLNKNNTALKALMLSVIINERDNSYGGQASGEYASLAYAPFALGTPSRNIIGTQPPVEKEWQVSDKVWNVNPVGQSYLGWVCVESGIPGMWEPFGFLGARGSAANLSAPEPGQDATIEEVVIGADSRLINPRDPNTHALSHSLTGTDPITPINIGAFSVENNLSEIVDPELAKRNLVIGSLAKYDLPDHPGSGNLLTYSVDASAFVWTPSITELSVGAANGIAGLDQDAKVPLWQLPYFVAEAADFSQLPPLGEFEKVYITRDNNFVYSWTGEEYVTVVRPSTADPLPLGTLDSPSAVVGESIWYSKGDHVHPKPTLSAIAVVGYEYVEPTGSAFQLTNFPTLNQDTSGVAANVTGVVLPLHGGTGTTGLSGILMGNATDPVTVAIAGSDYLKPTGSAFQLTNFPRLNQDTTGVAANVTGVVQLEHGGTGSINPIGALINLGAVPSVTIGQPGGVAALDNDGKVPSSQLPSFVDDVIERSVFTALPTVGETGKIYVTLNDNVMYRWGGANYQRLNSQTSGDTVGTTLSSTVVKIQGRDVRSTAPLDRQGLLWQSEVSAWCPTELPAVTRATLERAAVLNSGSIAIGLCALGVEPYTPEYRVTPQSYPVTYTRTTSTLTVSGYPTGQYYSRGALISITSATQNEINGTYKVITSGAYPYRTFTITNPTPTLPLLSGVAVLRASMNNIAIGHDALNSSSIASNNIVIGSSSGVTYYNGGQIRTVAIGHNTKNGPESTSIGHFTVAAQYGVTVGRYSNSDQNCIAVGNVTWSSGWGTIGIGSQVRAGSNSVAIGESASTDVNCICIGSGNAVSGSICIGNSSKSNKDSVSIGTSTLAANNSIVVGARSVGGTDNSITIGADASIRGMFNVAPLRSQPSLTDVSAPPLGGQTYLFVADTTGLYTGMRVYGPYDINKQQPLSILGVDNYSNVITVDVPPFYVNTQVVTTGGVLTFQHAIYNVYNNTISNTSNVITLTSTENIFVGMECTGVTITTAYKVFVTGVFDRTHIAISTTPISNASIGQTNSLLQFKYGHYRNQYMFSVNSSSNIVTVLSGADLTNVSKGDIVLGGCFELDETSTKMQCIVVDKINNTLILSKPPISTNSLLLTFIPAGGIAIGTGAVATGNSLALGSASHPLNTHSIVGAAGLAYPLPARPKLYLDVTINGLDLVIPAYLKQS